jgi:hypothetical protein
MTYVLEKIGAKATRPTGSANYSTIADLITALANHGFRFQALVSTGYAAGDVVDPVSGKTMTEEGGYVHIIARGGGKRARLLRRLQRTASPGTNLIGIVTDNIRTAFQNLEADLS